MKLQFRRIRHPYDPRLFEYVCNNKIKKSESGFSLLREKMRVNNSYAEDLTFWTHEFTELSIARILNRWKKHPFHIYVKFKGYERATIPHFISLCGDNNGRNLEPEEKLEW